MKDSKITKLEDIDIKACPELHAAFAQLRDFVQAFAYAGLVVVVKPISNNDNQIDYSIEIYRTTSTT